MNNSDEQAERTIEQLREQHVADPEYMKLVAASELAQRELESVYPQLFKTNEDIDRYRKERRNLVENDAEFKRLNDERAAAYRTQQEYLFQHDPKLAGLRKRIERTQN